VVRLAGSEGPVEGRMGWFSFSLNPCSWFFSSGKDVFCGCGWVEHSSDSWLFLVLRGWVGSAHCWVLRRHPPAGGCFFWSLLAWTV
jgi:hypothetical protein